MHHALILNILWKTIEAVMKAGATMINVPDTVGYADPEEFGELIYKLNDRMKNLNDQGITKCSLS